MLKLERDVKDTAPAMLVVTSVLPLKSTVFADDTPFVGEEMLDTKRLVDDCRSNTGFDPWAKVDPPRATDAP